MVSVGILHLAVQICMARLVSEMTYYLSSLQTHSLSAQNVATGLLILYHVEACKDVPMSAHNFSL